MILHMTQQLCCRGMGENLLQSDDHWLNCNKAKFSSDLNCEQNAVSETVPRTISTTVYKVLVCGILFGHGIFIQSHIPGIILCNVSHFYLKRGEFLKVLLSTWILIGSLAPRHEYLEQYMNDGIYFVKPRD